MNIHNKKRNDSQLEIIFFVRIKHTRPKNILNSIIIF